MVIKLMRVYCYNTFTSKCQSLWLSVTASYFSCSIERQLQPISTVPIYLKIIYKRFPWALKKTFCFLYRNSRRTLRSGLRWSELLYGIQQPAHGTVSELFTTDRRRRSLRRDAVASTRHHHAVQLRAATEEHHKVLARQLESRRLHLTNTAVHQATSRQQDL